MNQYATDAWWLESTWTSEALKGMLMFHRHTPAQLLLKLPPVPTKKSELLAAFLEAWPTMELAVMVEVHQPTPALAAPAPSVPSPVRLLTTLLEAEPQAVPLEELEALEAQLSEMLAHDT
jgi:hypothetical protein